MIHILNDFCLYADEASFGIFFGRIGGISFKRIILD